MDDKRLADLLFAVRQMGDAFTMNEALGHLTCSEFAPVVDVLILAGEIEMAKNAVISHSWGDDDENDEHHDLFEGEGDDNEVAMAHVRAVAAQLGVQL